MYKQHQMNALNPFLNGQNNELKNATCKHTSTMSQGLWPAQYRMDGPKIRKASPIDRNHSHFIFVDNGTQQMFGTEIQFRAKLESAISEMKTDTGNSDEGTSFRFTRLCTGLPRVREKSGKNTIFSGSGKSQGILNWLKCGNPVVVLQPNRI